MIAANSSISLEFQPIIQVCGMGIFLAILDVHFREKRKSLNLLFKKKNELSEHFFSWHYSVKYS